MAASLDATLSIMFNALAAMIKIFLVSAVGILAAKFPRGDPLLPALMIKNLSKLTNNIFVPALIITSLGSAVTVPLLSRIGVLIFFCFIANTISYCFGYSIGRLLHGRSDDPMFTALTVAIGSPNAISLPIMVMQTMCEESYVKKDFGDSQSKCYAEATSMLFVYSIGWHLMFWSYGFPKLKQIRERFYSNLSDISIVLGEDSRTGEESKIERFLLEISFYKYRTQFLSWLKTIFMTPAMIAIFAGVSIGLIPYMQGLMFQDMSFLRPLGSAITTLGEPVVAVNCLIMSASLAQVDFSLHTDEAKESRQEDMSRNIEMTNQDSKSQNSANNLTSGGKYSKFFNVNLPSLNMNGINSNLPAYSRLEGDDESDSLRISDVENGFHDDVKRLFTIEEKEDNTEETKKGMELEKVFSLKGIENDVTVVSNVDDNPQINAIIKFDGRNSNLEMASNAILDSTFSKNSKIEDLSCLAVPRTVKKAPKILPPTYRSIFALIICRLILPPLAVIYVVLPAAISFNIISKDEKLMRLIISVESCSSSAQVMIIALNQIGIPEVATGLAYMYVFQYIASIFTITFWVTVAVSTIYD